MEELTFQQQSVIWGQAFEILVKRGVLGCLAERNLIDLDDKHLRPWRTMKLSSIYGAVARELQIIDETVKDQIDSALKHLASVAYGLGYTAIREYLRKLDTPLGNGDLRVRALWCPLSLPGGRDFESERDQICVEIHEMLGLKGAVDPALADKGMPARADFLFWLSGNHKEDYLLVQEYSFDMPSQISDFLKEDAHLDELMRYRRMVDSRGVFARVSAEVEEESFELSDDIKTHLSALTSDNKPFYKLCQACGYAESAVQLLDRYKQLQKPCVVRALAITPNGLESLAARYVPEGTKDPRFALMQQMGTAYRRASKVSDGDTEGLADQVESVFKQILTRLPKELRQGLRILGGDSPKPGDDYRLDFEERIPDFANPMQMYAKEEALALVPEQQALTDYFGVDVRTAMANALEELKPGAQPVALRDLHAAAVVAGMTAASPGKVNVLGLEGNPGIGKTTAVTRYLAKQDSGYLFLYVSPRVVINRDVTEKLARKDGAPSGILTVTTNAQIISAAERYHKSLVEKGLAEKRKIDGAVVVDGVANLVKPASSVLLLSPEEEHEIEAKHAGSRIGKTTLSENEDLVEERPLMGVLSAMSTTTKELLEHNPSVNRVVLTAALQGFREKGNGKNTIQALEKLFRESGEKGRMRKAGLDERREFARRMPTIVVMVDELAGDGAGAPFVHAVARWLKEEFIDPFDGEDCPFTVVLVVSDASLGNEVVLDRYLNAGDRTPDKVLVSRSRGKKHFDLAVSKVRIGAGKPKALHVMTNSYPASNLTVRYRVNLSAIKLEEKTPGILETPRQAIRREADKALLANAASEIRSAVAAGSQQVIYFAQDKLFLRSLRDALKEEDELGLDDKNVQILDSSVPASWRKKLVEQETRDRVRVFLMTSSGARGVSFPKTDCIIAAVPRFNVESALMEIAQLIYRGRGMYQDEEGNEVSGDNIPRTLVMLVDDFLIHEEELDRRQWLRQSLDLMTLLVMLRATIFTRITGDAGLRQSLALVPVGSVGVDELLSLMSQYVTQFISEADTYVKGGGSAELAGLVSKARTNCFELFSRFRLQATAKKDADGSSFVKDREAREFVAQASAPIAVLLPDAAGRPAIAEHMYFAGPLVLESWARFDKREVFSFEGQLTSVEQMTKQLYFQLKDIDSKEALPGSLRIPAANLYRLLAREKLGAATEFNTLKELRSPNTWVALPAAYAQFVTVGTHDEKTKQLEEPDLWREALGRTLSSSAGVMPAIPRYEGMPWVAGVGQTNPLKFDVVFDDRYFMASNELNLLNTLLLSEMEGA
ncbi:helicase [Ralstonia pseudosolanacearum]|uniref:hypothetical protein n=1 Tax=Ralstonia pseudosolanacearum TaxID=1310165 RepID=UPI0020068D81|nr:hypothetical protein [Ralstonia pseudosolanacearum]MCK4143762.1 helicase [Ralstonia pseudosolanacearum]